MDTNKVKVDYEIQWKTKEGKVIYFSDMEESHLINTINYVKKKKFRLEALEGLLMELDFRNNVRKLESKNNSILSGILNKLNS